MIAPMPSCVKASIQGLAPRARMASMSVYVLGYTTVELDPKEWPPENKRVTYSPPPGGALPRSPKLTQNAASLKAWPSMSVHTNVNLRWRRYKTVSSPSSVLPTRPTSNCKPPANRQAVLRAITAQKRDLFSFV